jgi:hypothetical protein
VGGLSADDIKLTEGKSPLGRHRHGWEDNIRMDPGETDGKVWTGFIRRRIGTSGGFF